MAKTFRAIYKDAQGRTYSCPVQVHDGQWMLLTTSGFAPITHSLDNEEHGVVVFDSYREEADMRLHLPERIGTENSFQQLQRAYVEQEIVAQRRHREQTRADAQNVAPDQSKISAARDLNTQFANAKKPRGRGVGVIPE